MKSARSELPANDDSRSTIHDPRSTAPALSELPAQSAGRIEGFTLVELIVVISIMILLAGMAIPAFTTLFKGGQLRDGTQNIEMAFRQGRLQATTRYRPVMVRLVPFIKTESGKAVDDTIKSTDITRWKIEIVDSDGDGDYVTDEDGNNLDFLPWAAADCPTFTNPDPTKQPPVGIIQGETSPGVWHTHPLPLGEEDDKLIESFEFPDKIYPRAGTHPNWSVDFGVFVFEANGSCRIWKADATGVIDNETTADFKILDAQGRPTKYDFRIDDPHLGDSAYCDIIPTTGVINVVIAPSP